MNKVRKIVAYKQHFEDFLRLQEPRVQDKIYKVLEIIETYERVPSKYLKQVKGHKKLYEARIQLGSNIWRVFCCFDGDQLVILFSGFQKKSQRTPTKEIKKAVNLMNEYMKSKTS